MMFTIPEKYITISGLQESISSAESFDEYREKALEYLNLDNEDILSNMIRAITFDETGYKGSEVYIVNPFLESDKGNQKLVLGVIYIFIRFVILNKQTDKNYYEVWLPLK